MGWHYHVALYLLAGAFLLSLHLALGGNMSRTRCRRFAGWYGKCCPGNGSRLVTFCGGSRMPKGATDRQDVPMHTAAHLQTPLIGPSLNY